MIMEGEGMVAVVRGLRDAGLAVTLLDSGRQYTLLPEAASQPVPINLTYATASQCSGETSRESAVQATDGRFASTYKLMHCHVTPTSPTDQVTEFPPQRAEIYPGHGNFEVGGQGSGENHCHPTRSNGYRGAMSWPDRGAIYSPRPSLQTDSFANSLRKYPSLSQDRSSEIVERLINFTQAKNSTRNRPTPSPTRNIESDVSTHTVTLEEARQTSRTQRYEPEVHVRSKRSDESPTKDRSRKVVVEREPLEPWRRSTFSKTNDVRYLRDVSKKVREGIRSLSAQPNNQPERLVRERIISPSIDQGRSTNKCSTNSVNMEIQAAVQMVSREIVTVPRIAPSQRNVAVSLTPTLSLAARRSEGSIALGDLDTTKHLTEIVQTHLDPVDINIQTVASAIEISNHKCKHRKRSKSQEEIRFNELMKNEILNLIQRLPLDTKCASLKSHRKSHNRSSKNNNISLKRVEDTKLYYNNNERRFERGHSKTNSKCVKKSLARIFHAEVTPYRMTNEDDLSELLQNWINLIPIKKTDEFSRNVDKEFLFYELFDYIKNGEYSLKEWDKGYNLKSEIINRLESIPLEIRGNRWVFENRLADILVDNINKIRKKTSNHLLLLEDRELRSRKSKFKMRCPTECELRNFVLKELSIFLKKSELKLNQQQVKEVENELTDLLYVSVELLRGAKDKHLKMNITELLVDYGVPEYQAIYFGNALIRHFRDMYINCREEKNIRSETFIVLSNTQTVQGKSNATANSFSIRSINEDDIQANLHAYTNELCCQIDDWLTHLPMSIPQERAFRQVVVNDLAGDIVDRHRYMELNPNSSRTEETELEHLKYQIFKWINKLVGEDNLETTKYASDLMRRIKDIPVPMLSRLRDLKEANQICCQNTDANNSDASVSIQFKTIPPYEKSLRRETCPKSNQANPICCQNTDANNSDASVAIQFKTIPPYEESLRETCPRSNQVPLNAEPGQQINQLSIHDNDDKAVCNQLNNTEQCCADITNEIAKTIDQLDEEYEEFVKDWVKLIPIHAPTAEEKVVADKARLGIHNGIWKLVSKLNCDPATYHNRFFYEDLLDDGIEDLLNCLPQTPELQSKKHLLKVKLIEKTADINDLIKANEVASFKHNLIKNIFSSLRKQGITNAKGDDPVNMYEKIQITKIVEEFLLCTSFKNDDKVKAEVYKKKLLKHIEDFFDDLKQHHPNEVKDIDIYLYKADIINILLMVRLPKEDIIKQEADSILLDLEIEQWYNDLPIIPSDDYKEQYQRSKQREMLAKKVKDFENANNDFSETALRLEVSKFIEKAPLKEGENVHINFMVEEFVNRIKSRPKQEITQNSKKVAFQTIPNYEEFGKDISFCSSFINPPIVPAQTHEPANSNNINKSKQCLKSCSQSVDNSTNLSKNKVLPKLQTNSSRVVIQEPPAYRTFNEGRPISSSFNSEENNQQWYTLEESPAVPNNLQYINMYDIPPYFSPEQRMSQRQKQHSVQRPKEDTVHKAVVENEYCCPKTLDLDYVSETEQKESTKQPSYSQKGGENQYPQKIKTSRGILGTSQIAGPSGYSAKFSENVNNIYNKGETCQPTDTCQINNSLTTPMTKFSGEQRPQPTNECSTACQTYDTNKPDQLREDNSITRENKQNAGTNTLSPSTPHNICPSVAAGPNTKRGKLGIRDKNLVRRRLSFDEFEEDDDEVPCRCLEKYFRIPKRYPCENFDNFPPCVPLLFPYPYFF